MHTVSLSYLHCTTLVDQQDLRKNYILEKKITICWFESMMIKLKDLKMMWNMHVKPPKKVLL